MNHAPGHDHDDGASLTRTAISATLHCLTGCAIGEVLGTVLATAFGAGALFIAFWAAVPVNRWLMGRGKGHAVVHAYH